MERLPQQMLKDAQRKSPIKQQQYRIQNHAKTLQNNEIPNIH